MCQKGELNKNKFLSYLPKKVFSRIGSFLVYAFPLGQVVATYSLPLVKKYPAVKHFFSIFPFLTIYKRFSYKNRLLPIAVGMFLNKLFLKRKNRNENVIIDTPYFFKHHIMHMFILMGTLIVPETFFLLFLPPSNFNEQIAFCKRIIVLNCIAFLPCMINALLGQYNNIPHVSKAVLCLIGDSPDEDGPRLKIIPWVNSFNSLKKKDRPKKQINKKKVEKQEDDFDELLKLYVENDLELKDIDLSKYNIEE